MDVVGHQDVGMQLATVRQAKLAEILQIALAINLAEEAGLAIVATLDGVLGNAGQIDSGLPCHTIPPLLTLSTLWRRWDAMYREIST